MAKVELSQADNDLPEMAAALHQRERVRGGLEREGAVDHGPEPVRRDRPVHRLEARAGAHRDALEADHGAEELADVELGLEPADEADDADEAADRRGGERLRQGLRTPGLDHDVDPAPARRLACSATPGRHLAV